MLNGLKVYFKYISISIRSQMEYKASFIMMSIGNFFITSIEFAIIVALFDRFNQIKGWTLYEVALFYGIINVAFALSESIGRGYDLFSRYVVNGDFDRMILRPRSFVLQILGAELQLMRIGRLLQGSVILIWAIVKLGLHMTLLKYLYLIFTIISGAMMFTGLFVIQALVSFWSIQSLEIMNTFTYGGVQMAQYPINIYRKWFQKIFIYFIPTACISYFPVIALLGKVNGNSIIVILSYLAPFLGVVFFAITLQLFKIGVKYYKSTGS